MKIAIAGNEMHGTSSFYRTIMINNDIHAVCTRFIACRFCRDCYITGLCSGFTADFNFPLSGCKDHIFRCRYCIFRLTLVPNVNIAISGCYGNTAVL